MTLTSPAILRLHKELSTINLPPEIKILYQPTLEPSDLQLVIRPSQGIFRDLSFTFEVLIDENYPHQHPKVTCLKQNLFHPNIDAQGHVCLNILRLDWKPTMGIKDIAIGLQMLLTEPGFEDPLNKDAAEMLLNDPQKFGEEARKSAESN